jgi:DnaJ-class molecular chaperone
MSDFYKILGLDKNASSDEIKKAYRKLSLKFHPDKNDGDKFFENMFKQIQGAYETLSHPVKKSIYDNEIKKSTYQNQKSNQSYNRYENLEPSIEYFTSSKLSFNNGDEIVFKWKVQNADIVE